MRLPYRNAPVVMKTASGRCRICCARCYADQKISFLEEREGELEGAGKKKESTEVRT